MHLISHGPPNYSGGIRVNQRFSTNNVGNIGACPQREIGVGRFVHAHSKCSLSKEGSRLCGALNSHNAHLGISYIDLDKLENEATP